MTYTHSDPIRQAVNRQLLRYMVGRKMFCSITGEVLDADTCAYLVDAEGDPNYVLSMTGYMRVADTPAMVISLAEKGYYLPAELPAPSVAERD